MSNTIIRPFLEKWLTGGKKRISFFFVLMSLHGAFAFGQEAVTLSSFLQKSHPGDYVVTQSGKIVTLIRIHQVSPESIAFEEISVPVKNLPQKKVSWPEWVKAKAPGHSSWSLTEIGFEKGQILKCYSFSRHAHLQLSPQESLMATLFQRQLTSLPLSERKRIGSAPQEGEADHRQYWNPPLIFQGEKEKGPHFDVFKTNWPEDGSPLEGETLTFYFDHERKTPFPYWIELQTTHGVFQVQTVDSGTGLESPLYQTQEIISYLNASKR